ncbi:hypothetical protein DFQ12_0682 [Sphingobacterium detergens]|uniref:Uncharacterized protein n=1 Tax=Sphingobacterium detergens TaxID=1145106 RepID=A0A420BGK6_SPHD1|nr:hypothetical protein DFQ12_0682 [Sphingobacterium detergens]
MIDSLIIGVLEIKSDQLNEKDRPYRKSYTKTSDIWRE